MTEETKEIAEKIIDGFVRAIQNLKLDIVSEIRKEIVTREEIRGIMEENTSKILEVFGSYEKELENLGLMVNKHERALTGVKDEMIRD